MSSKAGAYGKDALLGDPSHTDEVHHDTSGTFPSIDPENEVKDRLNLIYMVAMALGFGILNTYNFLVWYFVI